MSYVYIIRAKNTRSYKIGISENPENRLKRLQTANQRKLVLEFFFFVENARKTESHLHDMHKEKREEGEWFRLSEEDLQVTIDYCKQFEIEKPSKDAKKPKRKFNCQNCGKEHSSYNSRARFCSNYCRTAHYQRSTNYSSKKGTRKKDEIMLLIREEKVSIDETTKLLAQQRERLFKLMEELIKL